MEAESTSANGRPLHRPPVRSYRWNGDMHLELGSRTLIMGILNATPDSFSDGGRFQAVEAAVEQACKMAAEGADIIDIGGESTRPGSEPVSPEEELRRVLPVIREVRAALPDAVLSIDTYRAGTARRALEAGVQIVNDIWGLKADPAMAAVAAEYGCPVILSHNRRQAGYGDPVADVIADLRESVAIAHAAGIRDDHIWLDPGIGFAKNYEDNLNMMGNLDKLAALGYPVLLGTSRKLFIRTTLQLPADEVMFGTAATVTLGIAKGCQIVRVHDVLPMKQTAIMTDAIVYREFQSS